MASTALRQEPPKMGLAQSRIHTEGCGSAESRRQSRSSRGRRGRQPSRTRSQLCESTASRRCCFNWAFHSCFCRIRIRIRTHLSTQIPEDQTLRNDYSQYFVDSGAGRLPGNAVRNPGEETRFDEYPKLKRLVQVKDSLVTSVAHPPTYLCADLKESLVSFTGPSHRQSRHSAQGSQTHSSHSSRTPSASQTPQNQAIELEPDSTIDRSDANKDDSANSISPASFHLTSLTPIKYDVVLIDPPLETYEWEAIPNSAPSAGRPWTWDEIAALPVPQVAAKERSVLPPIDPRDVSWLTCDELLFLQL